MPNRNLSISSEDPVNIFDLIFKIILLIFCLAMTGLLIYAVFVSDDKPVDKFFKIIVSSGGISGAFYLYMRWRVIELILNKIEASTETISPEIIRQAFSLIPSKIKEGKRHDAKQSEN